jgi:hypothetical protein
VSPNAAASDPFFRSPSPGFKSSIARQKRNSEWSNPDHFAKCMNFEQSLLKLMTSEKR